MTFNDFQSCQSNNEAAESGNQSRSDRDNKDLVKQGYFQMSLLKHSDV